ncbi:30S ribosomal protein S8 [Candidatus Vidania fulgoroideorum]
MSYKKISYFISNFNNSICLNRKYILCPFSGYLMLIISKLKIIGILKSFIKKGDKILISYNYKNWYRNCYRKISIISKSSNKFFLNKKNFYKYKNNLLLVTTNLGILTYEECLKKNVGGEIILNIL